MKRSAKCVLGLIFSLFMLFGFVSFAGDLGCDNVAQRGQVQSGCSHVLKSGGITGTWDDGGLLCSGAPTDCPGPFRF